MLSLEKIAVSLVIIIVSFGLTLANAKATFSSANGAIDLFTQKEFCDGRGFKMPSDSFGPNEEVKIFALVTYSGIPEMNLPVAFQIFGPKNPIENFTLVRTAYTNASGIALITFRMPHLHTHVFGQWTVIGNVKIADLVVQDEVSFEVGLIVDIVSIRTLSEESVDQEKFTRKSYVGLELGLRSIALIEKRITVATAVYDSKGIRLSSVEENDFVIQPDGVLVYFHSFLCIPESAHLGTAVVYASAYTKPVTSGGVPYCPEASQSFIITNRDIAILSVQPSISLVSKGETVFIEVCVENKGWEDESFNVQAYSNGTLIGQKPVIRLRLSSKTALNFAWNTSSVERGVYQLSASIDHVSGEINVLDNYFIGSSVEVESKFHDIAILNIASSSNSFSIQATVDIYVTAENQGNFAESFEVTLFYDSHYGPIIIDKMVVEDLEPKTQEMLFFQWDTKNVAKGKYTLSAIAEPVLGEENLDNNHCANCVVDIFAAQRVWLFPQWLILLLFPPSILIILLLAYMLVTRTRMKKRAEKAFNSGWTAWYKRQPLEQKTES